MASAQGKKLRLYVDFMSQPSRAVIIFSRLHSLPVDVQLVNIRKGETRSPAYLALNPLGKVPLLEDPDIPEPGPVAAPATLPAPGAVLVPVPAPAGSQVAAAPALPGARGPAAPAPPACFRLPESAAIISYLSYKFPGMVPEHWYPRTDLVQRARVDSALHWYQGNIRAGAMRLVFNKVVAGLLGMQGDDKVAAHGLATLHAALAALQTNWLADGSRLFMAGDQPCAADLLAACELEQLAMLRQRDHGTSSEQILAPYPAVRAWQQRVRDACAPQYGEVHRVLRAAAGTGAARAGGGAAGAGAGSRPAARL